MNLLKQSKQVIQIVEDARGSITYLIERMNHNLIKHKVKQVMLWRMYIFNQKLLGCKIEFIIWKHY